MEKQYGDWLRAGSTSKGSNEEVRDSGKSRYGSKTESFRGSDKGGHESKNGDEMGKTVQVTAGEREASVRTEDEMRNGWDGRVSLEGRDRFEKPEKQELVDRAERVAVSHQKGCDNVSTPRQTRNHLVGDLSETKGKEMASWVGLTGEPKLKERGAADPPKPKMSIIEQEEDSSLKPKRTEKNITEEEGKAGPNKGKNRTGKGNLKKVAREVGKAQGADSKSLEIVVGTKRCKNTDTLVEKEGRLQKRSCDEEGKNNAVFCENFFEETAVATRQHRREQ